MTAKRRISRSAITTGLILAALIAVLVLSFVLAPTAAEFSGADSQATERVTEVDPGYEPWFESVFSPGSSEVESGLFALQAAIGAGIIGYVFGVLRTRRKQERQRTQGEVSGGSDPVR